MPQNQQGFSIKVLTINTHKDFAPFNRRFILPELRDAVRATSADMVFPQEVMGTYAIHLEGHHGNAVLSRFPITAYENRNISVAGSENRGMLHCQIALPEPHGTLHVICMHLGLKESHRHAQMKMLCEMVSSLPPDSPVVVAGNFNDWQRRANQILKHGAGLKEVFSMKTGRPAILRFDRIYVRNATVSHPWTLPRNPWSHLSDHALLAVEIHL